jgi:hypothetical protein
MLVMLRQEVLQSPSIKEPSHDAAGNKARPKRVNESKARGQQLSKKLLPARL